jgi:hypothetical protein
MSFIWNWAEEKISGYAKTGIQAGGTLAGNAVGGVGTLVEGAGKSAASGTADRSLQHNTSTDSI